MKKRTRGVAIFAGIVMVGMTAVWIASYSLAWHLRANGIAMKGGGFRVKEYDEFYFGGRRNIEITAHKEDEIIRVKIVKNIEEKQARERIDGIFRTMDAHFEPQEILGIYADLIAAVARVPDELKPVKGSARIMESDVPYFQAYADRYFSYFVMTHDQATYRGMLTLVYCAKREELVNIEVLAPKQTFDSDKARQRLESFTCK